MKFSLITATLGRVSEFERLLHSLSSQTFKDFELIVIDQNEHRQLEEICSRFNNLNIKYIRSDKKGLSLNRNIGLKYVRGEIIGFPDDDCYYDDNLLEKVSEKFEKYPLYKLVAVEAKGIGTGIIFRKKLNHNIKRRNLFKSCISFNFFIRHKTYMAFDERFGIGSMFGSGEETDFLWEYFSKNDNGVFADDTYCYHPAGLKIYDKGKSYKYGLGYGAIYKKEIVKRKNYSALFTFLFSIICTLGATILKKPRNFHFCRLKGKVEGFLKYN